MRYKLLGKSGLRVSEVALGTMMLGLETDSSAGPKESMEIMESYADKGGNYFDAANEVYNGGLSEKILGEFVNQDRNRYVVTTKFTNTIPNFMNPEVRNHPNASGNHKKSMVQSVEGSLQRLGMDYIDLLWIHLWDYSVDIEDVMRNVNDMVQQGKILHFGLCNTPAWVVAKGQTAAIKNGWEPISALQYEYSLLQRHLEHEHIPCARSFGINVTAFSPLAGGFLTGKYTRGGDSDHKRYDNEFWSSVYQFGDREVNIAHKVDEIADKLGTSSAAVALAWVREHGIIPLVGARKVSQIEDSLSYLDLVLPEADVQELDQISAPERNNIYKALHDPDHVIRQLASCGMLDLIDIEHFPSGC